MRIIQPRIREKEIMVTCDCCGKPCKKPSDHNFEYMNLEVIWGYDSDHDDEKWTAQVCQDCVHKVFEPLIKFKKREYGNTHNSMWNWDATVVMSDPDKFLQENFPGFENKDHVDIEIDPEPNPLATEILFPEKLQKANDQLSKSGLPNFDEPSQKSDV